MIYGTFKDPHAWVLVVVAIAVVSALIAICTLVVGRLPTIQLVLLVMVTVAAAGSWFVFKLFE